jgi:hypothetical protein
MSTINPNQINTSIFGMASAVFTSVCAMLVTTAVKGNLVVEKTANTLIHGISAAENIAEAVEGRSKIYGEGMVRNGELAERETTLKYKLRLANLERQEEIVRNGGEYVPEATLGDKLTKALKEAKDSVVGSAQAADSSVKITSAVPIRP